jgi:hypothetical protein
MATKAKLELEFTGLPSVNDSVQVAVTGAGITNLPVTMVEIAKTTRTGAGEFSIGVDESANALNLNNAFQDDYVYYQNRPFITYKTGNSVFVEATQFGITITPTVSSSNITVTNTPEILDALAIDTVVISEAATDPCLNCKQTVTLKAGQKGTAPYEIHMYGQAPIIAVNEAALVFEVARSKGFSQYNTFQIKDDDDNWTPATIFGGLQYWNESNFIITYTPKESNTVDVTLTKSLQEANTSADQYIVIEIKIEDFEGGIIRDWAPQFQEGVTGTFTYNLEDQPMKISVRDNYGCTKLDYSTYTGDGFTLDTLYMKSNSLNFIPNITPTYQNFTNTLYCDLKIKNGLILPYTQKYLQSSNLWIQFQANVSEATGVSAALINNGTSTDISGSITRLSTVEEVTWWKLKPDISALDGEYQIIITFTDGYLNTYSYISELFQVKESYTEPLSLVKWKNLNDNYAYPDGILWEENELQEMLIDAEFTEFNTASEKTVLKDTDNRLININAEPTAQDTLTIYKIPYYLKEKLLLATNHYYFEVNGIEYQTPETPEINAYTTSTMYNGKIELQRVEYEIY